MKADLIDGRRVQRETMNGKAGGFGRVLWPLRWDELEPIHTDFTETQVPLPTGQTKPRLLLSCSQVDQKFYEHS